MLPAKRALQYQPKQKCKLLRKGKTVKIPYKGPVEDTIRSFLGGIRSSCTYVGAKRLKDLPKCTTFLRVTTQVNNKYN